MSICGAKLESVSFWTSPACRNGFFLDFLRRLLIDVSVKDLIVTVTVPERYADELSDERAEPSPLPGWIDEESSDFDDCLLLLGIGYQPPSVDSLLGETVRN